MQAPPRFTRLLCSHTLPAWFPIQHQPDCAMRLHHLGPPHPKQVAAPAGGRALAWVRSTSSKVISSPVRP